MEVINQASDKSPPAYNTSRLLKLQEEPGAGHSTQQLSELNCAKAASGSAPSSIPEAGEKHASNAPLALSEMGVRKASGSTLSPADTFICLGGRR